MDHPRLPEHELDRSLHLKIQAAERVGIALHIVTQFCFDPSAIHRWIRRVRDFGCEHQIRIGLTGPTNLTGLLRYAQRCGVRASAQNLARGSGLVRGTYRTLTPNDLVKILAEPSHAAPLGDIKPHFYSFGGLTTTAWWAMGVIQRCANLPNMKILGQSPS